MVIKGITVILHQRTQTGLDPFNAPVYEETVEEVENVLVAPSSSTEILDTMQLFGKKAIYTLGIPKGDSHRWEDSIVEFFDEKFQTIGKPTKGIDDLIPLEWNTKVQVALYE